MDRERRRDRLDLNAGFLTQPDGGDPPAARYVASARPYPAQLPALEYPGHFLVKRVTHAGTIRFEDRLLFLANALKEHHVGLEESDDGIWSLYVGPCCWARSTRRR